MPALAGPCTVVLSGCASAQPAHRQHTAGAARPGFTPLLATPAPLAAAQLQPESHFEGLTGAQVQTRARAPADVQVGHFQGVPSGWLARPVRLHLRVYAQKHETRGASCPYPASTRAWRTTRNWCMTG